MTMGPEPITRIEPMSSRLGTGHQLPEPFEQVPAVVGAGCGLGVVLDAEGRDIEAPQALEGAIVEVPVGQDDRAVCGLGLPLVTGGRCRGERVVPGAWIYGEAM